MREIKNSIRVIIGVAYIFIFMININAQDNDVLREKVLDNAVYVTQSVPTTMAIGETYNVIITVRNNGTTTWSPSSTVDIGGYKLALVDQGDNNRNTGYWGVTEAPVTKSIEPGETATFELKITAPSSAGSYPFQWVMKHGDVPFGEYSKEVMINVGYVSTVPNTMNSAAFVTQRVPDVMTAGNSYDVVITMTNTGTSTWNSGFYKLVYLDPRMNPNNNNVWGVSAVELPQTIAPGSTADFYFTVTAPRSAGEYPFQWGLVSSTGERFGDPSGYLSIKVEDANKGRNDDAPKPREGERKPDPDQK
jgi:hypothetical protein